MGEEEGLLIQGPASFIKMASGSVATKVVEALSGSRTALSSSPSAFRSRILLILSLNDVNGCDGGRCGGGGGGGGGCWDRDGEEVVVT